VVGAVSSEMRCCAAPKEVSQLQKLASCALLRIADEVGIHTAATEAAWKVHLDELDQQINPKPSVIDGALFATLDDLNEIYQKLENDTCLTGNVIFDVSTLPKRYFFYMLRRMIESPKVSNLIVTYAIPERYGKKLYENPGSWEPFPSFGPTHSTVERPMLVIAVGYHHLNLLDLIQDRPPRQIRLIKPFPSKPPGSIQNWEFIRFVRGQIAFQPQDIIRVNTYAAPLLFDHLVAQCQAQQEEVILAPYGPKPFSLGMALFALAREAQGLPVTVGYTQPKSYSSDYSTGVEIGYDGYPVVHSYCVKLNNKNLFSIT
jgi:hypothetical protein